jgi:acetylornithine deacetylase/succinyl-diaminopimelate desuccinylase-like protein
MIRNRLLTVGLPVLAGSLAVMMMPGSADASPPGSSVSNLIRAYRVAHEKAIVEEFESLLAIPNHATDQDNIRKNATAIVGLLNARQVKASLLEAPGSPPVVFGEASAPGATTTVTFYAHYDGQPVDPRQWTNAPFSPTLRDGPVEKGGRALDLARLSGGLDPDWRLYARSASDDKAPIIGLLVALDALRAAGVAPSVNLKFFFEGEEEIGSPHLGEILRKYEDVLQTDVWVLCDGPVHQDGRKQVFFGARGILSLEMTVYGPNHGLHSGHYGNWAPNPIVMLTHLLDSMRDTDARILIAGFYDDVRHLSRAEAQAVRNDPNQEDLLKQTLGIARSEGEPASLARQLLKPALNVHGVQAGHVGLDAANIIESEARASIDFRLVPQERPEHVRRLVERHIARQGYFIVGTAPDTQTRLHHGRIVLLSWGSGGYPGARTSMDLPISRAIVAAVEKSIGAKVLQVPSLGGSVPMYLFAGPRNRPVVGIPVANYDNNQHTADENIRLGHLWDGIEIYAEVISSLGMLCAEGCR